jgi:hypothetical protein
MRSKKKKTFNSGDSPVVTHLTTSPPVRCLNRAERTGSLVLNVLWSNVKDLVGERIYIVAIHGGNSLMDFSILLDAITGIWVHLLSLLLCGQCLGTFLLY